MAEKPQKCRIVFMGTPAFAASILKDLLSWSYSEVVAVYTQPDRPAGRGNRLVPSPVKQEALAQGIPVLQPETLKDAEAQSVLSAFKPDFLVVAAYGMILPEAVLNIPRYVPVNVHTSLLPAYRGAAPVQRAIMDGCSETGVSIMRMDVGLDTGPWYAQKSIATEGETTGSLLEKLASLSYPLLIEVLFSIMEGTAVEHPQSGEATYAAKISKSEGLINWNSPLASVDAHVRAVTPDPGAHAEIAFSNGKSVSIVIEAVEKDTEMVGFPAATVVAKKRQMCIACTDGALSIRQLKPKGKKSMDIASFLNGIRLAPSSWTEIGRIVTERH